MIVTRTVLKNVDHLIERLGTSISWLLPIMALLVLAIVIMRYCFSIGSVAVQELVEYLHATVFMLGISYTLKNDAHVRVDIFYRSVERLTSAYINLFGTIFFLFPLCAVIIVSSWDYVLSSWWILERSEERSGIAFVYGLKTLLLIMPLLLGLQGVVIAHREITLITKKLRHPKDEVITNNDE